MNRKYLFIILGLALIPTGCTLAPHYTRSDELPVSATWPEGPAYPSAGSAVSSETAAELFWQDFLTDEELRQVVATALSNSRNLRLAALNVEHARALYGVQRAELYPTLDSNAGWRKARTSVDLTDPADPRTTEQYSVNFGSLSWEIDFFGRIRSLKDEALAKYLATEQARRGTQILLVSSVVDTYLALAADRENLALAEQTFEAQQAAYDLVQRQCEEDVATELDLRQARIPVDTARREAVRYTRLVAQDRNALDLLVGVPVPDALLPADLDTISPIREVFPGLPSEVLLSRPDILAAEQQLRAAHAFLGAARAAFFPRISLTGALGTASYELDGLFRSGRGTWSFAPGLTMPIFDTRTWSAYRVSQVQRKLAQTEYELAIQSAFREVADALAARGTADRQLAAQQSLVDSLTESYRLSRLRFEQGIDSYLGVLDAQRSLFAAQQQLVALRLARFVSQTRLYAALGGGWQEKADVHQDQ